ncbi:mast cell carboxypeptidase A-like [Vanessa atalanta]|uniref:mast cell carboxypeptidase A-like n=1 Tax=Vanessa atalanta TaxID=42275 RepID=UPI001FCD5050|nr:mast cell carboxypeptidase A-like [Vanessa atalanta]
MNLSIFLIILGFTELVFSSSVNSTKDDSCHVCTLSYFRRKRAISEYTRWYSNLETTQEFIVKVLDDDVSTANKPIAAVNIQPLTKAQEKIIIGGAVVPSPTTEITLDPSKEYTRFIPPTTLSVTKIDGSIILAPIKPYSKVIPPIRPKGIEIKHGSGRHPQRDESPPASPKFLPRSQTHIGRQYAPIAPVSFTRRHTIGPLTPRTVDNFILHKTTLSPTRTFSYPDIVMPTRTSSFRNLFTFEYTSELFDNSKPSRTTPSTQINPHRTSLRAHEEVDDNEDSKTNDKDGGGRNYEEEDELENEVVNITAKSIFGVATIKVSDSIVLQLKQWAEESPIAKRLDITNGNFTVMENPIYMMIVDDPTSGQIVSAKKTVMIVAGIQGRDHHAVTAAMYVLYQLIERSEARADLLTKFRFWIIPVFNPDGYDYSMTFPHRREWSKNLRQSWDSCKGRESCQACEDFGLRCTIQPCYGVNLDRNFEYQWIPPEELRAEHPCGSLYAGPRQLSETETYALTHFLHDQRSPLYAFIAFKEGDVLGILYPYSHTNKRRALDHIHRPRASRAASAAFSISGRMYVAGQTSEFLPLYAGGIEDWVDGHLGIDNTYTVMMFRPIDVQNSKLAMERVVHEAYAAVDTLLLQSIEPVAPPHVTLTRSKASQSVVPLKGCAIIVIFAIRYIRYG